MIGFAAERLMELEVGANTGADYGEKSSERLAQRNGYRDRDWLTRGPAASNFASRACALAPVSRPFSSRGDRWRRR